MDYLGLRFGNNEVLRGHQSPVETDAATGSPTLPTNTSLGDTLLLIVQATTRQLYGASTCTVSGWTKLVEQEVEYDATSGGFSVYRSLWTKVAGASESAPTVNVSAAFYTSTAQWSAEITAFRGITYSGNATSTTTATGDVSMPSVSGRFKVCHMFANEDGGDSPATNGDVHGYDYRISAGAGATAGLLLWGYGSTMPELNTAGTPTRLLASLGHSGGAGGIIVS